MCDDKRARIMQAVEALLTERRWHEITTDDVAAAAHVGKGTLYKYFHDKDDLLFQTAMAGFEELCGLLSSHGGSDASFESQLLNACSEIGAFFRRRRQVFRLMQTEEGAQPWCRPEIRERWQERRRRLIDALAAVMQKGIDEGVVRGDVPAEVLASFFLGMLRTRARDLMELPEAARSNRLLVDLFIQGAGSRAAAPVPVSSNL